MTSIVLADIGGTHVRFGTVADDGTIQHPLRYKAEDYPSLIDILQVYCSETNRPVGGALAIASAANPESDGVWRFISLKTNRWDINPVTLEQAGWSVRLLTKDFTASAFGAVTAEKGGAQLLYAGSPAEETGRVILGPGTGLGLTYLFPLENGRWYNQPRSGGHYGGHMLATALTDEQHEILKLVGKIRGGERVVIFEDVASGWGLPLLYKAICQLQSHKVAHQTGEAIVGHPDDLAVRETLRLFHEFLGLFAHNAIVTGHAYSGLYLEGGLLLRLNNLGLFDVQSFLRFIHLPLVPIVEDSLRGVPIWLVTDPFVALKGLKEMVAENV